VKASGIPRGEAGSETKGDGPLGFAGCARRRDRLRVTLGLAAARDGGVVVGICSGVMGPGCAGGDVCGLAVAAGFVGIIGDIGEAREVN
jgi:hypothetical protein